MNRVFVWNEKACSPVGPFDRKVISSLVKNGVVKAETLVASNGEDFWTAAADHPATATWVAPHAINQKPVRQPRAQVVDAGYSLPRHADYDPDYDLDILDLNPGNRRSIRDFAILMLALNTLVGLGCLYLPFNPISVAFLLSLFIGGNLSLSWIFGVVLR